MTGERLRIKDWNRFQHYRDRNPEWIKLYGRLLDDIEWHDLTGDAAKTLVGLWLLAREDSGSLPDRKRIAFRLRLSESKLDQQLILLQHWLEDGPAPTREEWASRYVSKAARDEVMERDGNCCRECQSTTDLEIDHVVPISRGGSGEIENLQVLCRSCNRKKRSRVSAEQDATQMHSMCSGLRSLEKEKEEEKEKQDKTEKETRASALVPSDWPSDFKNLFWEAYPNKIGKPDALKRLNRIRLSGKVSFTDLMSGLSRYLQKKDDRPWCNPATWLNQERWSDQPASVPRTPVHRDVQQQKSDEAINALKRSISRDRERSSGEDHRVFPADHGERTKDFSNGVDRDPVDTLAPSGHEGSEPAPRSAGQVQVHALHRRNS